MSNARHYLAISWSSNAPHIKEENVAKAPKPKLPNLLPNVADIIKKPVSQMSVQELGIIGNAIVGSVMGNGGGLAAQLRTIVQAFNQECFLRAERLLRIAASEKNQDALKDAAGLMKYLSTERLAQLNGLLVKAMKANAP